MAQTKRALGPLTCALFLSFVLSVSSADAHTLTIGRAQQATKHFASQIFYADDIQSMTPAPTDYDAGQCERKNPHAVSCVWAIDFDDGSYCGAGTIVSFRGPRSKALRIRNASDVMCFDANDRPLGNSDSYPKALNKTASAE